MSGTIHSETGSSPLARGGLRRRPDRLPDHGLIPARAGRTEWLSVSRARQRAHPRSRGEDSFTSWKSATGQGSSPLARGGLETQAGTGSRPGLIPARAGRTRGLRASRSTGRAHPRSRGEDALELLAAEAAAGSSPLARGGRAVDRRRRVVRGLIPARAGRTPRPAPRGPGPPAHPRSRGEDRMPARGVQLVAGSSPLARGGPPGEGARDGQDGLIPARAGRTRSAQASSCRRRAHPRSRGEDDEPAANAAPVPGSSPLARGGHRGDAGSAGAEGLIPARAGRTVSSVSAMSALRAHPRSRGEDSFTSWKSATGQGSSPLARGGPSGRRQT